MNIRKKAQALSSRVQRVTSKRDDTTKKSGTGGFDVKSGGPISTADKESGI